MTILCVPDRRPLLFSHIYSLNWVIPVHLFHTHSRPGQLGFQCIGVDLQIHVRTLSTNILYLN